MLLGILLAGLKTISTALFVKEKCGLADLGWLAYFEADRLPLIRVVLFDRIKECLALPKHQNLGESGPLKDSPRLPQTLHSAYPRNVSYKI